MQDLLTKILWPSEEIHQAADQLRKAMPGFQEAKRTYDELAQQNCTAAGYDLYDRYFTQLMRYSSYEICAYYSLGLGLRGELFRSLTP